MKIFTEIIGNIHDNTEWEDKLTNAHIEKANLEQWTEQKSRILINTDNNKENAVS